MLEQMSQYATRVMLRVIEIAIGVAAGAGRLCVLPKDFDEAGRICKHGNNQKCYGFIRKAPHTY
jgi:hypothetical protein